MKNILAIDPGTKTGATIISHTHNITELWDNKPLSKTKKREGEPKYFRLKKLWDKLNENWDAQVVVCEGAAGFQRGKSAVEASHKFRAVIELWCAVNDVEYIEIPPNDLKFFALGKRSGDKDEMIKAAQALGYEGNEDNEADSFLIAKWYISQQEKLNEI